jgi:hypothetical protein
MLRSLKGTSWRAASLLFALATSVEAQTGITGTWVTYNFGGNPNLIDLQVNGATVTGTISRNNEVNRIYDGSIAGSTVTFKVGTPGVSPRVITYTGRLNGDQMSFTRTVQVRVAGGAGIYGSGGPMEFSATRDTHPARAATRGLLGEWRLNLQRSTYDPGPAPTPIASDASSWVSLADGRLAFTIVSIANEGNPVVTFSILGADGRDHPSYNGNALAALVVDGTSSNLTRSLVAVSDRVFQMTNKTDGVVTSNNRLTLSADGNTLTVAQTIVNAQGQTTATNTLVYERPLPNRPPTN